MDDNPVNAAMLWWTLATLLVGAELLTGSFYLLMLAVGAVFAALSAHAGLGGSVQMATASVVSIAAALCCYFVRKKRIAKEKPVEENRNVNLDIGETVNVRQWQADKTAQVQYRGAAWTVQFAQADAEPTAGPHRICAVVGNRLVVEKI